MAEPSGARNISQALFMMDEKLMTSKPFNPTPTPMPTPIPNPNRNPNTTKSPISPSTSSPSPSPSMQFKREPEPSNLSHALYNQHSVSDWNALQMKQGIENQLPAYINQARLSTYYQDNPWPTLLFSSRFGLTPPGGEVNGGITPGSRPGNTLNYNVGIPKYPVGPPNTNTIRPVDVNGVYIPSFNNKF